MRSLSRFLPIVAGAAAGAVIAAIISSGGGTKRGLAYRGAMHELVKPKPLHAIVRVTRRIEWTATRDLLEIVSDEELVDDDAERLLRHCKRHRRVRSESEHPHSI